MKKDIRLYKIEADNSLKLLAIVHRFKSSVWEIYYNKIGTFEAHITFDKDIASAVFDNDWIIAVEGYNQAIITGKAINTEIVLYGKTLNYLFSKRTVKPFNSKNMTWLLNGPIPNGTSLEKYNNPVIICNELVYEAFALDRAADTYEWDSENNKAIINEGAVILPGAGADKVSFSFEAYDTSLTKTDTNFYRTANNPLSEVIIERLAADGLGHSLTYNKGIWEFRVYKGEEKELLLSESNRNIYDVGYTEDIQNYFLGGFYEDTSTTDAEEEISEEDREQKSYFVQLDEYNTSTPSICVWDTSLTGSSKSEAVDNLRTKRHTKEIKCSIAGLVYGADYMLGDILRIQLVKEGFKKTFKKRVCGIKIYCEGSMRSEEPILEEVDIS